MIVRSLCVFFSLQLCTGIVFLYLKLGHFLVRKGEALLLVTLAENDEDPEIWILHRCTSVRLVEICHRPAGVSEPHLYGDCL